MKKYYVVCFCWFLLPLLYFRKYFGFFVVGISLQIVRRSTNAIDNFKNFNFVLRLQDTHKVGIIFLKKCHRNRNRIWARNYVNPKFVVLFEKDFSPSNFGIYQEFESIFSDRK